MPKIRLTPEERELIIDTWVKYTQIEAVVKLRELHPSTTLRDAKDTTDPLNGEVMRRRFERSPISQFIVDPHCPHCGRVTQRGITCTCQTS